MGWLQDQKKRIEDEKATEKARMDKIAEEGRYYRKRAFDDLTSFYKNKMKELEGCEAKYGKISFDLKENSLIAFSGTTKIFHLNFWYYEADKWEGDCQVPSGEHYLKRIVSFDHNWVDAKGNARKAGHEDMWNEERLGEYIIFLMDAK